LRIIPVIDVMGGVVVRAVGGRRHEYRPLASRLTASTNPLIVANAMCEAVGALELYIADLDAIRDDGVPTAAVRQSVESFQVPVWLDVGIRRMEELAKLPLAVRAILASETLTELPDVWPSQGEIFSLDLMGGELRTGWPNTKVALTLAEYVYNIGCRTYIILDVAAVGERNGPNTLELCKQLQNRLPHVELISGGGIRNPDDVKRFQDAGCEAVLVSTAIHDGNQLT